MGSLYNKTSETSHGNIINNIKQHQRAIYQVLKPNSKNHHFQSKFMKSCIYIYITIEMLAHPYLNSANSTAK